MVFRSEQVKEAKQREEEESVPAVKEILEETKDEEVTKEAIMAMYAHCNVVELDTETSVPPNLVCDGDTSQTYL